MQQTGSSESMRRVYVMALATIVVTLILITLGGYVRQSGAGLACPDWPLCHGQVGPPLDKEGTLIEFSHRVVGLIVSLLALAVGLLAIKYRRESSFILRAAIISGFLIVGQVLLGAAVVLIELQPFLIMGHLALALTFLATIIVIGLAARSRIQPFVEGSWATTAGERRLLVVTLVSLGALLLVGAFAGGGGAAMSCTGWPLCNGQLIPTGEFAGLWQVWIIYAHRLLTISTAVLVLILGWRWRRHEVPALRMHAGLAAIWMILQIGLGALNPLFLIPIAVAVAHLGVAAIIWAHLVIAAVIGLGVLPAAETKAPTR
ncbi:MAG: COX15/CtaA family protein [Chloroflexota bacterium]|jgi:heme A synthase|nr:COX15/CtaA family protein [Chloroflexota bacterium]MDP6508458.1 COX15/CtaA family protein [Chloroflexota bacterium]MDP6756755.1 COX15/CtaA family protein [Chloroflexota bacterium]